MTFFIQSDLMCPKEISSQPTWREAENGTVFLQAPYRDHTGGMCNRQMLLRLQKWYMADPLVHVETRTETCLCLEKKLCSMEHEIGLSARLLHQAEVPQI